MLVVAVIALFLAVVSMGVAVRAWPRQGVRAARPRRPPVGRLTLAVEVLVALDVVAAGVLGYSVLHNNSSGSPRRTAQSAGAPSSTSPPPPSTPSTVSPSTTSLAPKSTSSSAPSTSTPAKATTSTSVKPTTSTPAKKPAGAKPVLDAVSPARGAPGQVVTLTGEGLFSPNGLITVDFGPAQAPVRCPTETTCHATVPARPAGTSSRSVVVSVTTNAGRSNGVTFSYS